MGDFKQCEGDSEGRHHFEQLKDMPEGKPAIFCVNCGNGKGLVIEYPESAE